LMLGKGEEEKGRRGAVEHFRLTDEWMEFSFSTAGRTMNPSLANWYSPQLRLDGQGAAWFDMLQVVPDMEMKNKRGEVETGRRIELLSNHEGSSIFYTLDGSEPTMDSQAYTLPFLLKNSGLVKASSFKDGKLNGSVYSNITVHKASSAIVSYNTHYEKYTAGGDNALVDGIFGTGNYKDGKWQGFHGEDAEFVINLGKVDTVNSVRVTFLQDVHVWIFLPVQVTISLSKDGINYDKMIITSSDIPLDKREAVIFPFEADFNASEAKFIKVQARNIKTCPEWHPGAGGKAWLFVDEVEVN